MKNTTSTILTVLVLAVGLYFVWLVIGSLFSWVTGLEPDVIAAMSTAFIGLFGLFYVQWTTKNKDIAENHRPEKIKVYEIFFDIIDAHFSKPKEKHEELEITDELKTQFSELSRGMVVWSSPEVIKAWNTFREIPAKGNSSPHEALVDIDKVLLAIRSDLGNSNFGLKPGDVIKVYLKGGENVEGK